MIESVQVFGDQEAAQMFSELGRQMPFAVSTTLNGLANRTQEMTKDEVRARFTLRRPDFVVNTVLRKRGEDFALKTNLQAAVRIDERRDFLAKFETGGSKAPVSGRSLAIPIAVRRNKADIVTKANTPRGLMGKKGVERIGNLLVQFTKKKVTTLYRFVGQVWIPDRLSMRENAEKVSTNDFERIANESIDKALSTAIRK